jgi:hypothetical protein
MITLPFLPAAVQTARNGELAVRRQVEEGHLAEFRAAARRRGIVMRTVCVKSSAEPSTLWIFSNDPIPHDHLPVRHPAPS